MKLKVQQVFDATLTIAKIIRENRPMPQKGAYRLARMHGKLMPEFTVANARRDEMIKAYDHHEMMFGEDDKFSHYSEEFSVPADKMTEFMAAWKEIGDEEIEVEVEPVPLAYIDLGDSVAGSITANELITLGELVRE